MLSRLTNPPLPAPNEALSAHAMPVRVGVKVGSHKFGFAADFFPIASGSHPGDASESANRLAGVDVFRSVHIGDK